MFSLQEASLMSLHPAEIWISSTTSSGCGGSHRVLCLAAQEPNKWCIGLIISPWLQNETLGFAFCPSRLAVLLCYTSCREMIGLLHCNITGFKRVVCVQGNITQNPLHREGGASTNGITITTQWRLDNRKHMNPAYKSVIDISLWSACVCMWVRVRVSQWIYH